MEPDRVTQREPGGLFVIRNAGNRVPTRGPEPGGVTVSVEYAVTALGVTEMVICRHAECGTMTASAARQRRDALPAVRNWLRYADPARAITVAREARDRCECVASMACEHVIAPLANLATPPCVRLARQQRCRALRGWACNIATDTIDAFDGTHHRCVARADTPQTRATPARLGLAT